MTGPPGAQRFDQRASAINPARLVLTRIADGFIRARSSDLTMPRVASTSRICSETTSHCSKKAALLAAVS